MFGRAQDVGDAIAAEEALMSADLAGENAR
jgi:hypothetical protein